MKRIVLSLVVLLVVGDAFGQQANPARATPSPAASLAPLADEKTLKIVDTAPADANGNPAPTSSGDLTIWDFLRMILILALVIGMVVGFIYLLKRLSGQNNQSDSPIKVLHSHVLAGSRILYIVEIGNEVLLVGSGDSSVGLVKQITDQETIDQLRLAASQKKTNTLKSNFAGILSQVLGKKDKPPVQNAEEPSKSSDFLKKQRERLKNL